MKTPEAISDEYISSTYGEGDFTEHNWYRSAQECFLAGFERGKREGFAAGWNAGLQNKQEEMMQAARQAIYSSCDTNLLWAPEEMAKKHLVLLGFGRGMGSHFKNAFRAGYKAAMSNSPGKPDSWISVEDRLPDLGKFVLVYGNDGSLDVRAVSERADYPWPPLWLDGWGESADYRVTHWMEIPELPKEEA